MTGGGAEDMSEDLPIPDDNLHNVRPGCAGSGLGRRQNQISMLERYGLASSSRVLEIGCGVGWLAYDLAPRLTDGAYVGMDVSDTAIAWLNQHYAARRANLRFHFLDVKNSHYRPKGAHKAENMRFPCDDDDFDLVCAFNVFTYLSAPEIANYLQEVSRVLRAGGIGLFTIKAIIDGDVASRVGSTYRRGRGGVYRPKGGGAIAYDDTLIRSMIERAQLDLRAFELGTWHKSTSVVTAPDAGLSPRPGADLYVVTPHKAR
jgi:SAM-dependent methyltransferase